jgi:hypothetical protein
MCYNISPNLSTVILQPCYKKQGITKCLTFLCTCFDVLTSNHSENGIRLVCDDVEVCVTLQITVH